MVVNQEKAAAQIASMFIHNTRQHVFLTGKAGTGKTTFLKSIIQKTHKNVVVAAPTGIAAINAGGVTLHSLFHLPFSAFVPDNGYIPNARVQSKITTPYSLIKEMQMNSSKRKLLQEMELLVIDEVSMLRADLLDAIDSVLRYVRRENQKAFGGVQVLFIGDLLQLPPVVKEEEWNVLHSYYPSIYFFDAKVLRENRPLYIELDKIYRQTDPQFLSILNHLRDNKLTDEDMTLLNRYYRPHFEAQSGDGYIQLTTHNNKADLQNKQELLKLDTKSFFFQASVEGEFPEFTYPLEKTLELKEGAQVMFVKNDSTGKQLYFNGKIGTIHLLTENRIEVSFSDGSPSVDVERYVWENKKYSLDENTNEIEENTVGKFIQYPLKLAWAITVHKSQGLTFQKAILDVSAVFAPGQMYVALSRLTSLQGLVLSSPIRHTNLNQDRSVLRFADSKEEPDILETIFERESTGYFREFLLNAFDLSSLWVNCLNHVKSYHMDELRSEKQKYSNWALALQKELESLKTVSDKFLGQLSKLLDAQGEDYLNSLFDRVTAAKNYFEPLFKTLSENLLAHIGNLQGEKKVKGYLEEVKELERLFFKQWQTILKAQALLKASVDKKEWTKEEISDAALLDARKKQMLETLKEPAKGKRKVTASSEKKPKGPKVHSRETSYELYTMGKTVEEIAAERSVTASTIESHLSYYVSLGKITVENFMKASKVDLILETAKALDTTLYGPIKQSLGEQVTFSEIRLAMAHHDFLEGKNSADK
jgi:hypothetical protein